MTRCVHYPPDRCEWNPNKNRRYCDGCQDYLEDSKFSIPQESPVKVSPSRKCICIKHDQALFYVYEVDGEQRIVCQECEDLFYLGEREETSFKATERTPRKVKVSFTPRGEVG